MRQIFIRRLALPLVLFILLAGCDSIELPDMGEFDWRDKSARLEGKVLDGRDRPIANVSVTARMVEPVKGYEQSRATTSADGTFRLGRLYPRSSHILSFHSERWVRPIEMAVESVSEGGALVLPEPVRVRFMDRREGTVMDTRTGLMWAGRDNGEGLTWDEARRFCEQYNAGGYTDWRMPAPEELQSLYDRDQAGPKGLHVTPLIAIESSAFWTSRTQGQEATVFGFDNGLQYRLQKSIGYRVVRVLPVRTPKKND